MKGKLEFDLSVEDDKLKFEIAVRSGSIFSCLKDFNDYLRNKTKYNYDETTKPIYEEIRREFFEFVTDNNVGDLL